jgi:hypothetical protein
MCWTMCPLGLLEPRWTMCNLCEIVLNDVLNYMLNCVNVCGLKLCEIVLEIYVVEFVKPHFKNT